MRAALGALLWFTICVVVAAIADVLLEGIGLPPRSRSLGSFVIGYGLAVWMARRYARVTSQNRRGGWPPKR
jgi:hypothetical protein